jgi:hypothetical protein
MSSLTSTCLSVLYLRFIVDCYAAAMTDASDSTCLSFLYLRCVVDCDFAALTHAQ